MQVDGITISNLSLVLILMLLSPSYEGLQVDVSVLCSIKEPIFSFESIVLLFTPSDLVFLTSLSLTKCQCNTSRFNYARAMNVIIGFACQYSFHWPKTRTASLIAKVNVSHFKSINIFNRLNFGNSADTCSQYFFLFLTCTTRTELSVVPFVSKSCNARHKLL